MLSSSGNRRPSSWLALVCLLGAGQFYFLRKLSILVHVLWLSSFCLLRPSAGCHHPRAAHRQHRLEPLTAEVLCYSSSQIPGPAKGCVPTFLQRILEDICLSFPPPGKAPLLSCISFLNSFNYDFKRFPKTFQESIITWPLHLSQCLILLMFLPLL